MAGCGCAGQGGARSGEVVTVRRGGKERGGGQPPAEMFSKACGMAATVATVATACRVRSDGDGAYELSAAQCQTRWQHRRVPVPRAKSEAKLRPSRPRCV